MSQSSLTPLAPNTLTFRLLPRQVLPSGTSITIAGLTGTQTPSTPAKATAQGASPSAHGSDGWQQWSQLLIGQSNGIAGALNSISITLAPRFSLFNITLRVTNLTGAKVICLPMPSALFGGLSSSLPGLTVASPAEALTCQPAAGQPNGVPVCSVIDSPTLPNLLLPGGSVLYFPSINIPQVCNFRLPEINCSFAAIAAHYIEP